MLDWMNGPNTDCKNNRTPVTGFGNHGAGNASRGSMKFHRDPGTGGRDINGR